MQDVTIAASVSLLNDVTLT